LRKYIKPIVQFLRRNVVSGCFLFLVHNQLGKIKLLIGNIGTNSGTVHSDLTVADSISYIDRVFNEYKSEAGIDRFYGRAAEIGPGDNCGVGLCLINDGCDSVDLVDRFYSRRNDIQHQEIYRRLIVKSDRLRSIMGDAVSEKEFSGINRYYGNSASSEKFFNNNTGYDLIVSRAVLEHVVDPITSIKKMSAALNPGGLMMHVVDLKDHGMFTSVGYAPTKFLEIPQWFYKEMTQAVGRPNRIPISAYRNIVSECGLDATFKVTQLIGQEKLDKPCLYEEIDESDRQKAINCVASMRHRLARILRKETDKDLSIAGFFLVAKKSETKS